MALVLSSLLSLAWPGVAAAAEWPARPVHIIVPVAPGTATDVTARVIANELGRKFNQRFLVDDRPGGNGAIGAEMVASAAPDGYTLLFTAASVLTITPHLVDTLPWDALKDFTPVVELGTTPIAIAVTKTSPIGSLDDLVARAKASPGTLKAGIIPLSMSDFAVRFLETAAGVKVRSVSYNTGAEIISAALSGEVDFISFGIGGSAAQAGPDGRLRALAMTTTTRLASFPDVRTVAETYPGYDAGSWFGFLGPKKLDPSVQSRLNAAVNEFIKAPEVVRKLDELGTVPVGGTPDDLRRVLNGDYERFGAAVKQDAASK